MRGTDTFLEGRIFPPLMRYIAPFALSLMLQSMYGLIDLWVVSRYSGAISITAVSTGAQVTTFITAFITGLCTGATVLIAKAIGNKNHKRASAIANALIRLMMIMGIMLALVTIIGASIITKAMNIPVQAEPEMLHYMQICGFGIIFVTAYNVIHSFFRSRGNSKIPLLFILVSCIVNLCGDFILVAGYHMEATGAAISTLVAQIVSFIVSITYLMREERYFEFCLKQKNTHHEIIRILKIGSPLAINEILTGLSFLIVTSLINSLGLVTSTSIAISEKMFTFLVLIPVAFLHGLAAFVAQNIGAGKQSRARKALKISIIVALLFGTVMFIMTNIFGAQLVMIFEKDSQIVRSAGAYLKAGSFEYLFLALTYCLQGYLNGLGKTKLVMLFAVVTAFFIRVPLTYLVIHSSDPSMEKIGGVVSISAGVNMLFYILYYIRLTRNTVDREKENRIS